MTTPLRYDERAALHGAGSELHWRSIVRSIMRLRSGALPSDWQARVVDAGLYAKVSAHWPPPVCVGRWIADCSPAPHVRPGARAASTCPKGTP